MQNYFKLYKNLPSTVYRIALVRFILAMGNFIFPFMTLFLVKKLGIAPDIASIYYITSGLTFVPSAIISGRIADKIGRRFILLSSFFIYILIIFLIFFLYNFDILKNEIIAIMLIISSLFISMTQVPIAAIITDVTEPSNRNESFSLTYLTNNLGFAFGPLVAGFLFENYTSLIFLGNAVFSLIGFLILLGIKETRPVENQILNQQDSKNIQQDKVTATSENLILQQQDSQNIVENKKTMKKENLDEKNNLNEKNTELQKSQKSDSVLNFIFKDKIFLIFIFSTIFFSFAYSQAGFTLPIFLTNIFGTKGAKFYGILQSSNALTVIFFTPLISLLTKNKSPFLMVAVAGIFYAFGFGFYSIFKIMPLFIFTTIIWSIGEIIQVTHQNVFIANRSPINIRGQVNSAFQILSGTGFILGPVFSGFIQKYNKISTIWYLVFLLSLTGSLMLSLSYKKNS